MRTETSSVSLRTQKKVKKNKNSTISKNDLFLMNSAICPFKHIFGGLTAELTISPKPLVFFLLFTICEPAKAVYLSLEPLPFILVSVLIRYFSPPVLLATDELSLVEVSPLHPLCPIAVPLDPPLFVEADVSEVEFPGVAPDSCLGLLRHEGKNQTIFVFLYGEIGFLLVHQKMFKNFLPRFDYFLLGTVFV